MLTKNQLLWAEALESGEYLQGRLELKSGNKYCCLGVACDLYQKHTGISLEGTAFTGHSNDQRLDGDLERVRQWVGLKGGAGEFTGESVRVFQRHGLAELNDVGIPFKERRTVYDL